MNLHKSKRSQKRILAFLLTLIMLCTTLPQTNSLYAADETEKSVKTTTASDELSSSEKNDNANKAVSLNRKTFPDRALLLYVQQFDRNKDHILAAEELRRVVSLDISETKIVKLKGLENFRQLRYLRINAVQKKTFAAENFPNLLRAVCGRDIIDLRRQEQTPGEILPDRNGEEDIPQEEAGLLKGDADAQIPDDENRGESTETSVGEIPAFPGNNGSSEGKQETAGEITDSEGKQETAAGITDNVDTAAQETTGGNGSLADKDSTGGHAAETTLGEAAATENAGAAKAAETTGGVASAWLAQTPSRAKTADGEKEKEGSLALAPEAAKTYTVTFKADNGTAAAKVSVTSGKKVDKPADPKRNGYLFAGWYKGNALYNFSSKVTSSFTLTAKWTKVSVGAVTILKLKNGGTAKLRTTWKKVSGVAGYEITYSQSALFGGDTKILYATASANSKVRSNCVQGKTYYVRVRAYKMDSAGKKVFGAYSRTLNMKITNGLKAVSAKANSATITSCKVVGGLKIQVNASFANTYVNSSDNLYYVFSVPSYVSQPTALTQPVAAVEKKATLSITTPIKNGTPDSVLQNKFLVAVKNGNAYKVICTPVFVTNPGYIAQFNYSFPGASTKKGLQVNTNYLSDAKTLGVKHAAVNILINDVIATKDEQNDVLGIPYTYNGTVYWYSREVVSRYDEILDEMHNQGIVVSAIFLLGWRDDLSYLIPSKARVKGYTYYGLSSSSKAARAQLEAFFTFMARRYCQNARIANWILGNEVNNFKDWNYSGTTSLSSNAMAYARAFRMVSTAVRSVYIHARVYISLDHRWNISSTGNYFGAKAFLDKFAEDINMEGAINYGIAYHPYPSPDTNAAFWENANGLLSNNINSPVINFGNISILTDYVKKTYGSDKRIIFSEQGFTSGNNSEAEQKMQAAAIVYAYYLTEFNDMVDSFIMHRHIDHRVESAMGLNLGLWTTDPSSDLQEKPLAKKYAYNVYKKMDHNNAASTVKFALTLIGKKSWNALIPNFTWSHFPA